MRVGYGLRRRIRAVRGGGDPIHRDSILDKAVPDWRVMMAQTHRNSPCPILCPRVFELCFRTDRRHGGSPTGVRRATGGGSGGVAERDESAFAGGFGADRQPLQGAWRPPGGYCRRQGDTLHFLLQGRRAGGAARPASRGRSFDVYRLFAAGDGAGATGGRPRQVEGISHATAGEWIIGSEAERLSQDPAFRLIGSEKTWDRGAAPTSRGQTFETEMLADEEDFKEAKDNGSADGKND